MLRAMSRLFLLATLVLAGCGSKSQEKGPVTNQGQGSEKTVVAPPPQDGSAQVTGAIVDDPKFHLQPEEGTLKVGTAEGKAGAESSASLEVTPASGYHMATDFPIKLTLEAPAGVKLAKAELTAGGRDKLQGDATSLTEQSLAFAVKATAEKAGSYEIKGWFKFGVCDKDSCHPKRQPIAITVAAN